MAALIPFKTIIAQATGYAIDFDDDALAMALCADGEEPPDVTSSGVAFLADLFATHPEVTGYTRKPILGGAVTTASETAQFSFTSLTFPRDPLGPENVRFAVGFKDTGDDATSRIFSISDLGRTYSLREKSLTLSAPVGGLLSWRVE